MQADLEEWPVETVNNQTLLYQVDTTCFQRRAKVLEIRNNMVRLDQVIFYPHGGGQAGDQGMFTCADGTSTSVIDTRRDQDGVWLQCEDVRCSVHEEVDCQLAHNRRLQHMRLHTALHLMCALYAYPVTGCKISEDKATLDMNILDEEPPTKEATQHGLDRLIEEDHPVKLMLLDRRRTYANVFPGSLERLAEKLPSHLGPRLRVVCIGQIDRQFCGGTHVSSTAEIGQIKVTKIENKGKRNRRFVLKIGS